MSEALLLHYQRRALGEPIQPSLKTPPRSDIVHVHAEIVKRSDELKRLAGKELTDGGRKS